MFDHRTILGTGGTQTPAPESGSALVGQGPDPDRGELELAGGGISLEDKGDKAATWSHREGEDLGNPALPRVAKKFGCSLDQLRELL